MPTVLTAAAPLAPYCSPHSSVTSLAEVGGNQWDRRTASGETRDRARWCMQHHSMVVYVAHAKVLLMFAQIGTSLLTVGQPEA